MRTKSIEQATKVEHTVTAPVTVLEYQPNNHTRYLLHITDLRGLDGAPSTVTDYVGRGAFFVALYTQGHGTCMTVADTGGYLSPSYVGEKLGVGAGDAGVLAEIIAKYTGRMVPESVSAPISPG